MTHYHKCCKITDLPLTLNIMRLQFFSPFPPLPVHPFCFSHPSFISLTCSTSLSLHKLCLPLLVFLISVLFIPYLLDVSPFCLASLHSFIWALLATLPYFQCVCCVLVSPVYVYIAEATQHKMAKSTANTGWQATHKHTTSELSTSPAQSETLRRQLYGPWLANATECSLTKCVCVAVGWFSRVPSFLRGEILSNRAITQSALCIQHSRSMTCQPGLWIAVMDL